MNELLSHITEEPAAMPKTTFIQIDALPVDKYPETVRPLETACPTEIRKRARHNHKIIEGLEKEIVAVRKTIEELEKDGDTIRKNPVYKILVWLRVLPKLKTTRTDVVSRDVSDLIRMDGNPPLINLVEKGGK